MPNRERQSRLPLQTVLVDFEFARFVSVEIRLRTYRLLAFQNLPLTFSAKEVNRTKPLVAILESASCNLTLRARGRPFQVERADFGQPRAEAGLP
jgi:hypothetical protein